MNTIKSVLMNRDGMTPAQADNTIADAKDLFFELLADGDMESLDDFCGDQFGLEPDYIEEFL